MFYIQNDNAQTAQRHWCRASPITTPEGNTNVTNCISCIGMKHATKIDRETYSLW